MPNFISEDDIEKAILKRLNEQHGFELLNCYTVNAAEINDRSNRNDKRDVVLGDRLKQAAQRLNPHIPETVIDDVVAQMIMVDEAHQQILIKSVSN